MFYASIFLCSEAHCVILLYPDLTCVASSPPPLQTFSCFENFLGFIFTDTLMLISLFCSIKSAQNKQKEWNIFSTGMSTYMPGIIQNQYGKLLLLLCSRYSPYLSPFSSSFLKYYHLVPFSPRIHITPEWGEGRLCI